MLPSHAVVIQILIITQECERVLEQLVRNRNARRARFGSYTFDADIEQGVVIKWEGHSDVVHVLELLGEIDLSTAVAAPMQACAQHQLPGIEARLTGLAMALPSVMSGRNA